jgi:hypothetical protein
MMRLRCIGAKKRRREAATAAVPEPAQTTAARPVIFAETEAPPAAMSLQTEALLDRWPPGYEHGSFRFAGNDIVLSAPGREDLRIEEAL